MLVELGLVEQRYRAVCEVLEGATVVDVARRNGVARQTVHDWMRSYAVHGLAGLPDRSSKPDSCPHQMSAVVEARIVALRRAHPGWGPRSIVHQLELDAVTACELAGVPLFQLFYLTLQGEAELNAGHPERAADILVGPPTRPCDWRAALRAGDAPPGLGGGRRAGSRRPRPTDGPLRLLTADGGEDVELGRSPGREHGGGDPGQHGEDHEQS